MRKKNKLVEWKALVDTVGIKGADLEDKFCSIVLRLPELPRCRERPPTAISRLEWLGRLKCLETGLDASLPSLSTSRRCSRDRWLGLRPLFRQFAKPQISRTKIIFQTGTLYSHDINERFLFNYCNIIQIVRAPTLISCSPNLPRVYIRLCKHGNHLHFFNLFLFSHHHIPTNSVAPFSAFKHSHNPQFLLSLWWRAYARNVSI